jgi:Damage-control phosphatase ARMT1-like domain
MYTPTLAVPPPLRGADAGSFAEHSIAHRLPHIAQRVLADNSLTSAMRHRIENVMAAIPYRTLEAFTNPEAPDMPRWQDYMQPSRWLRHHADSGLRTLGERLQACVRHRRLQVHAHPFWTSPLPMWEMPDDLREILAAADVVIAKGDTNYRRALGDAHWPFTTPLTTVDVFSKTFLRSGHNRNLLGPAHRRSAQSSSPRSCFVFAKHRK